jgi:hypothetical protein
MALYLLNAIGPASASTSSTCSASPRKRALPNGDKESLSLDDTARLTLAWGGANETQRPGGSRQATRGVFKA